MKNKAWILDELDYNMGMQKQGKRSWTKKIKREDISLFWLKVGSLCGSKKQEQLTEGLLSMLKKIWSSIWQAC